MTVDLTKVPRKFIRDVELYVEGNEIRKKVSDLTPREFLTYCLNWHGLVGWDNDLVELFEACGWKRSDDGKL